MDKSREVFINMCEKAEEIQKLWEPKRGDIVYDVANNRNIWHSIDWHVITTAFTIVETDSMSICIRIYAKKKIISGYPHKTSYRS